MRIKKILDTKQKDSTVNTSILEDQIDEMVYELYKLTDDEIRIVEGLVR